MLKKLLFIAILGLSSLTVAAEQELELGELNLEQYRGKVVYLDFWASWCAPCRASFPWMNQLHADMSQRGLQVVAVNVDANQEAANTFLQKYPAQFSIVYDPLGMIAEQYEVMAMPSSFLINAQGELVASYQGFNLNKADEVRERIESLLNKP